MIYRKNYNQSFVKNRAGTFAVAIAILLPVLLVGISTAIDMSRYMIIKSKFNAALDGAALAASTVIETQDEVEVANNFFQANFPEKYMQSLNFISEGKSGPVELEVERGGTNNKLSLRASARAKVTLTFAGLIGMDEIEISHVAKVERLVNPNVEIILTIDISPSMCTTKEASNRPGVVWNLVPDLQCKKLMAMKSALKKFVEHVFANSAIDSIKIGIVPYNHKVHFPFVANGPSSIPPSVSNIEPSNYYTDLGDASPLPMIIPLTSNKATLLNMIDSLQLIKFDPPGSNQISEMATGWTRTTIGTHTAALMLDPTYYDYFSTDESLKPKQIGDPSADKVIVQMTDGASSGCCYGNINGDYSKQYMYLYKTDMNYQTQLCEAIKGPITIFSVIFDVEDSDYRDLTSQNISGYERNGGEWIKKVFLECSSNPDFFFDVPVPSSGVSTTEIDNVYTTIAQYFYKTRIVE